MKKLALALACSFIINCASAQESGKNSAITPNLKLSEQSIKIAYVDPYKVIQARPEQWKEQEAAIQTDLRKKNEQIEAKKSTYATKLNALQSMGTTAKPEVVTAKSVELKQLEIEINALGQSMQEYAERVAQEAQMAVFKEIEIAAQEIAMEKGLDIVLAGGVLFVSEKLDISSELITRMNAKYANKKKQEQAAAARVTAK